MKSDFNIIYEYEETLKAYLNQNNLNYYVKI